MTAGTRRARARDGDTVVGRGGSRSLASPELISPRLRKRRAFSLLALTLIAPGTAQIVAGNRTTGRIALKAFLGAAGTLLLAGLLLWIRRALVINLLARPLVLIVLALILAVLAIGWAYLFVDTWRLTRPALLPPPTRRWVAGVTSALILVTSGTLAWGANAARISAATFGSVFSSGTVASPSNGRYNILLLGGDSGADRVGMRPDTIMVASVDVFNGRTALFGFARDTENINFRPGSVMARLMPGGWNCGDQCLLNALYQWGQENASQFPEGTKDPGLVATEEAVESLSGLDIQYYAMVDLKGFQRFIDAVGGIEVNVGKATPIGGGSSPVKGYIQPGTQRLDGYHALWYARSREGSTNYERMERQKCVITAMLRQLDPRTVITKFQGIAGAAGSTLVTDIPAGQLGTMGDLALRARSQPMKSVNFVPPLINPWEYDPQVIRDTVRRTIEESGEAEPTGPAATAAASPLAGAGPVRLTAARQWRGTSTLVAETAAPVCSVP